jgi:2-hydroxy-6-oxonona-2,4-dienedioate hydrolase
MTASKASLMYGSDVFQSSAGTVEYGVEGRGSPVLMLHGAGGGFNQGLFFANALRQRGFQVIAPSRFGYLKSAFPADASPSHQADVLVELLDYLGVSQIPIIGGSAGALAAAALAIRHPQRCSQLVLLVPAANLSGRDPVVFTPTQRFAASFVLGSDFGFWALSSLMPGLMIRTLLATDPALLERAIPEEKQRASHILSGLMPISQKINGLRNDGFWSGAPTQLKFENIKTPTLVLSCEDDLFGTAETSRMLAQRITGAKVIIYPRGGHIWLGHDEDIANEVSIFIAPN